MPEQRYRVSPMEVFDDLTEEQHQQLVFSVIGIPNKESGKYWGLPEGLTALRKKAGISKGKGNRGSSEVTDEGAASNLKCNTP